MDKKKFMKTQKIFNTLCGNLLKEPLAWIAEGKNVYDFGWKGISSIFLGGLSPSASVIVMRDHRKIGEHMKRLQHHFTFYPMFPSFPLAEKKLAQITPGKLQNPLYQ